MYTLISRIVTLFIALTWLKTSIGGPKWKSIQRVDFNFTSNWRRFDVSMQQKNIVYRNIILERVRVPCD